MLPAFDASCRYFTKGALRTTVLWVLLAAPGQAALTISPGPTSNVSCSGGACAATAKAANLSVNDLQNMLASSSVKVATGMAANDIEVAAALTWASANGLTLDARQSIVVKNPVSVAGAGALTLTTNDGGSGGTVSFRTNGRIGFLGTSNPLTINGNAYTLVSNIATLASDIAASPSGSYALGANYDAIHDGKYTKSPIPTSFSGTFTGLGNSIRNLRVRDTTDADVGLFAEITGTVGDLLLRDIHVTGNYAVHYESVGTLAGENDGQVVGVNSSGAIWAPGPSSYDMGAGGLVGTNSGSVAKSSFSGFVYGAAGSAVGGLIGWKKSGSVRDSFATGAVFVRKGGGAVGGLVGSNSGLIATSYSTSTVACVSGCGAGGLVGYDGWVNTPASIDRSFATGSVSGASSFIGGLVGISSDDRITNSYALGSITAGPTEETYTGEGGLIGGEFGGVSLSSSYSTGTVVGGEELGGTLGYIQNHIAIENVIWDTTTSGISAPGCGNHKCAATGLTSAQIQAALPSGFDAAIWSESSNVNGGLPYLIANPPPK